MFTVKQLAKRLQNPRNCDYVSLKRAAKYLKFSVDWLVEMKVDKMTTDEVVKLFVDSDWAGDPDDARSTSGVRIS